MACEHDAAEMDTAAHWDGLCPLCMAAKIERLRKALGDLIDAYNSDVNPNDRNETAIEHARQAYQ